MKYAILAIVCLMVGFLSGRWSAPKDITTPTAYNKQCWDRAESLNRHAQGIYVEYSGYVFSGWSTDKGAVHTLDTDVGDYNNEVNAYNQSCDKQALTAPLL